MNIQFSSFDQKELARRETLFHVANGYLGLRGYFEEGVPPGARAIRGTYIYGFYDSSPIHFEERLHGFAKTQQSIVNIIDAQGVDIVLGDEAFSCFEGQLNSFDQELDMNTGVYTRRVDWTSPKGQQTRLVFSRLASFVKPQLALIKVDLTPINWTGTITLTSTQHGDVVQDFDLNDPRKASVGRKMIDITSASSNDGILLMNARTTQ